LAEHIQRISATAERNVLIRERYQQGKSLNEIGNEFGISIQRVHQIVNGRRK
jgi:DNA-directed RNA polymerase specialized sigma subunit